MVDGAFSAYMKEERKAYSLYTGIIHYDELRVAVKKGKEFPFSGIESLYGKTVGKGRGVYAGDAFDSAVGKGKIFLFDVDDMNMSNIRKLHEGRLDAVIGSPVAMQHYARELGYKDIVLLPGALREKIPAYLILSKHSGLKHKKRLATETDESDQRNACRRHHPCHLSALSYRNVLRLLRVSVFKPISGPAKAIEGPSSTRRPQRNSLIASPRMPAGTQSTDTSRKSADAPKNTSIFSLSRFKRREASGFSVPP